MLRKFCLLSRKSAGLIGNISVRRSMSKSVEEFVEAKLSGKKVVVFSKSYCPYCAKAKEALAKFKLSPDVYEVVEIEDRDDCDDIQAYMGKKTGGKSVPRVFINGKFIGGGDDTVKFEKSGELKKMLTDAGAI